YDNDFSIFLPVLSSLLLSSIVCIIVSQIVFKPEEYVC
ncbi:ABC transporter permease, partial [Bacillus atrophaeus]|nr:ABC transporter permease [Bacillus atrophaeus]